MPIAKTQLPDICDGPAHPRRCTWHTHCKYPGMRPYFAALLTLWFATPTKADSPQWQSVESIETTARTYVQLRGVKLGTMQRVEAGPLDARIRLTQCTNELSAAFAPGINVPP